MPFSHERRVQLTALLGGLPAVLFALILLWWLGDYTPKVQWTFTILILGFWLGAAAAVRENVAQPLRTLASLLEAMREGDYSIRARQPSNEEALGEALQQVNAIGATLRAQRLGALEAATLLRKVMEEIDVAVFTFDEKQRLKLVNRAGERLLGREAEDLLDQTVDDLELGDVLNGNEATIQRSFPGANGRWRISRGHFREEGLPLELLVLTDVTRVLREEELQAWQRIVRVLGHELNNSLTPIKSIAGSLELLLKKDPLPSDWHEDTQRGLEIITTRSDNLSRFMASYARLAKLPRPEIRDLDLKSLLSHIAHLETRKIVRLMDGPEIILHADREQVEHLFINLVRNAVDAMEGSNGEVQISWIRNGSQVEISVLDEGLGLANTANLFVPFFTTKQGGSGIGLVLSRQIAEAHGGSLTLTNRSDRDGCEAKLILPL